MKLILSSSDFGNIESAKFIYEHLGMPIENARVLYFPNEKATEASIKSGMYEKRLCAFGFREENIFVFDYYEPTKFCGLDIDAVYISGGNTFGTLKRIRETGFDKAIFDYVKKGAVYIGGSAGAHIATADISHVEKYDKDTFGLEDFSGIGLFGGILVCHYSEERKADYESLKVAGKYSVTALANNESILIEE
ncbi:MAG: Type 1 glutamine amidotransferase-like domain-containing protein [Clostridia bacterium]|nr:Type 1 glutamine amidotransferase-like domain-containing protein [Clostridia bacterium]